MKTLVSRTARIIPSGERPSPGSLDGRSNLPLDDLGLHTFILLPELLDHPEEPLPALLPLLELPDGDDGSHGPDGPLDDILLALVVDLLQELAEVLPGFQRIDLFDHVHKSPGMRSVRS